MQIFSFLRNHKGQTLFLPAHCRGQALPSELRKLLRDRPGIWDLPEIPGFGGPLLSNGAVADSQNYSAAAFGVEKCWYGVNGATGLLQAAILSLGSPGSGILLPRNVHKSVIQACLLGDITPIMFDLPFLSDRGHYLTPDSLWIDKVLEKISIENIQIKAVMLVNPSYHGYSSDIKKLIQKFHKKDIPVIVDEAHGAHFLCGLDELPQSGVTSGADIVVHSLHKSAHGLAQTAVLWMQGNKVDPIAIERSIGLIQTTSPSSLLLASCESTLRELRSLAGKNRLESTINNANEIFNKLLISEIPLLKTQDPLRLILHTAKNGFTGFDTDEWMINSGIYAELPDPATLTFCLGFAKHNRFVKSLIKAWQKLISKKSNMTSFPYFKSPPVKLIMSPEISCYSAFMGINKLIPLKESIGHIAADLICPYPPGIPFIIPGQFLEEDYVLWLLDQKSLWPNSISDKIRVVE
tara:strand:+ start:11815 stop:13209 length:1395 start_codon:yes stop_codon:yes gene_type:complete